jgi:hypothetical protein
MGYALVRAWPDGFTAKGHTRGRSPQTFSLLTARRSLASHRGGKAAVSPRIGRRGKASPHIGRQSRFADFWGKVTLNLVGLFCWDRRRLACLLRIGRCREMQARRLRAQVSGAQF